MRVQTRSWAEIVDYYRRLCDEHGMPLQAHLQLVRLLAVSPYAGGLFPYQSMHTLVLAQTPEVLPHQERIMIAPVEEGLWFALTDQTAWGSDTNAPRLRGELSWNTRCAASEGMATLIRLLDRLGWFPHFVQSLPGPAL